MDPMLSRQQISMASVKQKRCIGLSIVTVVGNCPRHFLTTWHNCNHGFNITMQYRSGSSDTHGLFSAFLFQREVTFMTSFLLPCSPSSFENEVDSKRQEFEFSPFRVGTVLTREIIPLPPLLITVLQVYAFPLILSYFFVFLSFSFYIPLYMYIYQYKR